MSSAARQAIVFFSIVTVLMLAGIGILSVFNIPFQGASYGVGVISATIAVRIALFVEMLA